MNTTVFFHKLGYRRDGRRAFIYVMVLLLAVIFLNSESIAQSSPRDPVQPQQSNTSPYRTIEWVDLMPKDDLEALLNPPDYLDDIEDGSEQDRLNSQFKPAIPQAEDDRYQQALKSTRIMPEFDNQKIRLPGYIVPLEFGKNQLVTRFFLVPYFGACIHVPPPPPNQIIYAVYDKGFKLNHLQEAFWLTGLLRTTLTENDVATSAYTLQVADIKPYSE